MHEILARAEKLGAEFADLRYYEVKELIISSTEQGVYISTNGSDVGYALRVLYEGNWGYVSASSITSEDVKRATASAYGNGKVNITYLPPKKDEVKIKQKREVNKSIEEIVKDLEKIKSRLLNENNIKSVNIRFFMSNIHKEYYSTEEREISQEYVINGISVSATAREGDVVASAYQGAYTYKGYPLEIFDENEIIETVIKRLKNQLKGKVPKGGEADVILGPDVVGVFSHEAVGHLAEADLAINGILSKLRGQKIAQEFVTIQDSPFLDYDRAIGITVYDDEGVEGRDVKIIDKGVVSEFLVDRYYSAYLGERPSGNARAEDFRSPVLIRMRNTYMLPGNHSLDEMIRDIKEGYFLLSPLGGQTSPDGTFQFGIQEGYTIRNGEIAEPLRNIGIAGYTLETLGKITAVSKEFDIWQGFCGKGGQSVPVGTGGPYIKVRVKVGGNV